MVWWRMFVLVFSLALAGPLPVTAAPTAHGGHCHQEQTPDRGSPDCCAGQDLATHCGTAACATHGAQLPASSAPCASGPLAGRADQRPSLPLPSGRSVAPEEPPPTA